MKNTLLSLVVLLGLASCSHGEKHGHGDQQHAHGEKKADCCGGVDDTNHQQYLEAATLWYQTAGETQALYLQGYELARLRLTEMLKQKAANKLAVVLDLDETVVDNSPFSGRVIKTGKGYPAGWNEWIASASAKALPGAVDFLRWAEKNNIEIFYISNRKVAEMEATLKNLKREKIPFKPENVLLRDKTSDKTERRAQVSQRYEIALLLGDNLGDFDQIFQDKSVKERWSLVARHAKEFGNRFIVFPNPTYGDWESAVYENNMKRDPEEKRKLRLKAIEAF
jgi:5'-nucleotidase (lipoprotein e(P4) family)